MCVCMAVAEQMTREANASIARYQMQTDARGEEYFMVSHDGIAR